MEIHAIIIEITQSLSLMKKDLNFKIGKEYSNKINNDNYKAPN